MTASSQFAQFAARLRFTDLPAEVVAGTVDLFVDWLGSALAGSRAQPVQQLQAFALQMGPQGGGAQLLGCRKFTSPWLAAMVNGASSHVVEQDDLHNQSVLHPATVVFPPLLALAQAGDNGRRFSGADLITAAVAGYECGIRAGEYLGRSHYRIFHTTATAGTLAAAMAVSNLLRLDDRQTLHALGSAGTQAAGLWQFLEDAADSKQLHAAKACADGLLSALLARSGFTGASQILEGHKGMQAGMLGEGDASKLTAQLGTRWATLETSYKFHASCRHTHPAADALLAIRTQPGFDFRRVKSVEVFVYQAAQDVLGLVDIPRSIHQSKFSMGFVLALIARYGSASVADFTPQALTDPDNLAFLNTVTMTVDPEIDQLYPAQWAARVVVELQTGERYCHSVTTPKGDPDNRLSRAELETKFLFLQSHFGAVDADESARLIKAAWHLAELDDVAAAFVL